MPTMNVCELKLTDETQLANREAERQVVEHEGTLAWSLIIKGARRSFGVPPESGIGKANRVGSLNRLHQGCRTLNDAIRIGHFSSIGILRDFALVQECFDSLDADDCLQQIRDRTREHVEWSPEDEEYSHGGEGNVRRELLMFELRVGGERHHSDQDRRREPKQGKEGIDDVEADKSA